MSVQTLWAVLRYALACMPVLLTLVIFGTHLFFMMTEQFSEGVALMPVMLVLNILVFLIYLPWMEKHTSFRLL